MSRKLSIRVITTAQRVRVFLGTTRQDRRFLLHIIATDGCFYGDGQFMTANRPAPQDLKPCSAGKCSSCSKPTACRTGLPSI